MAVTSTSAFISSTRSRNRHYVVIIACPEAISEAGLITCVKACGIAAAELAAGPVIRSAAPGIIIIVVIVEEPMKEYPDEMSRTMTLYMAPKETIDTYVDGYMYEGQDVKEKEIGVDTAKYLLHVDGRYEEIHTGADGYWGNHLEFSRGQGKSRILDAITVSVCMPEFEDFESMKRLTGYIFLDAQLLAEPDSQTEQIKME